MGKVLRPFGFAFGTDANPALDAMGPELDAMDAKLRELQATIDALMVSSVGEPPAALVSQLVGIKAQIETYIARVTALGLRAAERPTSTERDSVLQDTNNVLVRLNQLQTKAIDLQAKLNSPGAAAEVTRLDNGVTALSDIINHLEARANALIPGIVVIRPGNTTDGDEEEKKGIPAVFLVAGAVGIVLAGILLLKK